MIAELNERSREVFRLIVEAYCETGDPVGSRTVSRQLAQQLSPATVRNVMSDLEDLGLFCAPHTSAGRMPTDAGLRLFVDGMMQALEPTREEQAAIAARAGVGGPVEEALALLPQL